MAASASTLRVEAAGAPPAPPGELMSRGQRLRLLAMLGSFLAVMPLTVDMYLPALPEITAGLGTTPPAVQLTLTGTLVGLAAGQLLVGPLSDAVGRRIPLLAGLGVHVLASGLCALAPNVAWLGGLRVLQGFGVAAAMVVSIAVARDLFSGIGFARAYSRLMLVTGVVPILAPSLGGVVLRWTAWRGLFVTLGVCSLLLAILAGYGLRETLPRSRRRPARVRATLHYYGFMLRDPRFLGLVTVTGLTAAAIFIYVSGSSFVMQQQYGLTKHDFAMAFAAGSVALTTATQLNVRLLRYWSSQRILVVALFGAAGAALALVAVAATGAGGLPAFLIPLWAMLAAAGLILPNAIALAMTRHGEAAGAAGALLGAAQFGFGAVAAPVVGLLGAGSLAMASGMAGATMAAVGVILVALRHGRRAHRPPALRSYIPGTHAPNGYVANGYVANGHAPGGYAANGHAPGGYTARELVRRRYAAGRHVAGKHAAGKHSAGKHSARRRVSAARYAVPSQRTHDVHLGTTPAPADPGLPIRL